MRIAFVSTYPPRRCGIATFTSDLIHAIREADPSTRARIAAIDERNSVRAYGSEVRWRIRQGSPMPYRAAARAINRSNADVVCVQHEFGLYGLWKGGGWVGDHWIEGTYEDHLTPFLDELEKPALVTLHTVLPEPSPAVREAVRSIADSAHGLTVMAETAVDILRDVYGIAERPIVIPHGMPHIEPIGRRRLKAKLGLDHRQIVSTFGLVGPGKGLEYVIEAMPAVVARHPDALYLIAGQTHPELLKQRGEEYRNRLTALVEELGLTDNVVFVNQYLEQKDIIDYLLATDVYVTPYLDPNQITSGTLSYALGAGKAVVSTPYLHAKEALADERGLLVDFQAADQIADAVNTVLDDPKLKARLEKNAYRYANEATWPKTGARFLDVMRELVAEHPPVQKERRREKPLTVAHRLRSNPLIQPVDVEPQPGFEVISTINPGVATVGDETVLLVRVTERPKPEPGVDARMVDLSGSDPRLVPLPGGLRPEQLIGMAFFDHQQEPPKIVIGYVPRDLPGLDLSDPRTIRYRNTAGGFTQGQMEFTDYLSHISHLRVARSSDGNHFTIDPEPTIVSATPLEEYGVEDPRITWFGDVFHITYVAVSRLGITTARLTTTDFRSFERHGTMLEPDQKDVVLFPEQVGGRYLALTRPMPGSFGRVLGLWLTESDDLVHWGNPRPIAQPRSGTWDEMRIGASLVPIRVDGGWLEIYHGADRDNRYGVGALLLDAGDPTKVLARTDRPLLAPEAEYELDGFLHDVVFPSGHVDLGDGDIRVYYGAADTSVCAADMAIDDVLSALDPV
ncbi:MAG: glycosyltransferase [Actinobacteria bacterium]|nr:MAG: glycosyltransferase [Actinomycetota bacterium]